MNEYIRLNNIRKIANEISYQAKDSAYHNDEYRLKCALNYVSRSLGMIVEIEMDRIKGNNDPYVSLGYVEGKLGLALDFIMNPTKDDKFIDKPEPYVIDDKK